VDDPTVHVLGGHVAYVKKSKNCRNKHTTAARQHEHHRGTFSQQTDAKQEQSRGRERNTKKIEKSPLKKIKGNTPHKEQHRKPEIAH
jgi:hypothetical protein